MIQLTDAELCMLEQLVYLDEEVAAAAVCVRLRSAVRVLGRLWRLG